MSLKLIQYFVHDATINDSRIGGSQSLTISKNTDLSEFIPWGDPFLARANHRKKPKATFSLQKILTDDYGPTFPSFDVQNLVIKRPVDNYNLGATIYGGGSIKLIDCILTGISYSFNNEEFFTESLTFEGVVSEAAPSGNAGVGLTRNETGIPYQRQHFTGGTLPSEVVGQILLNVDIDLTINYNSLAQFGEFDIVETMFATFPVEVSSSFEILDRGYSQQYNDYLSNKVNDNLDYQSISISTIPVSIDLGDKNVLVSMERGGANAGDSGYSTIKFTYTNSNNYFKLIQ